VYRPKDDVPEAYETCPAKARKKGVLGRLGRQICQQLQSGTETYLFSLSLCSSSTTGRRGLRS
jgi:hypothetical protein